MYKAHCRGVNFFLFVGKFKMESFLVNMGCVVEDKDSLDPKDKVVAGILGSQVIYPLFPLHLGTIDQYIPAM